jgi:endonuclease/exonuclease/phosphatase (EEP) superfamily protein YafD
MALRCVWLPTIVAKLDLPPGKMTLVALHPSSPGSEWNHDARNAQLLAAAEIAAQQKGPVMMLGDFNTTSWSPVFSDVLATSGLRDSRLGFGVEPTWPGVPLPLRIPIDHCLVSPEIAITDRRVGPDIRSDHRPLVVDFAY